MMQRKDSCTISVGSVMSIYASKTGLSEIIDSLTIHFFKNLMLVLHVLNDNGTEVDISDVEVALFVQFGSNIGEATTQDHYLRLLIFVKPLFYHILQLLE